MPLLIAPIKKDIIKASRRYARTAKKVSETTEEVLLPIANKAFSKAEEDEEISVVSDVSSEDDILLVYCSIPRFDLYSEFINDGPLNKVRWLRMLLFLFNKSR
mmetsp:Transcript_22171/g.29521  ORF Transcript_22171/g.29521 Transcript_22171/m.29521 type:complete len:103 (+) Transcript_22171:640-948(+)